MSDKEIKESINPEDIEAKDTDRRKFIMGSAGTVVATAVAAAALSGCSVCDSDIGDTTVIADNDTGTYADVPYYADSDVTNAC